MPKWRAKVLLVGQGQLLEEFAALLQPLGAQAAELQQVLLACSFGEILGPPCVLSNAPWYQSITPLFSSHCLGIVILFWHGHLHSLGFFTYVDHSKTLKPSANGNTNCKRKLRQLCFAILAATEMPQAWAQHFWKTASSFEVESDLSATNNFPP